MDFKIGKPVTRLEDFRFLCGRGRYIGDVNVPGQAWAVFVRSPHAYAAIRSIDKSRASSAPGVLAVFTAADIEGEIGTTSVTVRRVRPDGSPMFWRAHRGLAVEHVRHVGDPVAMVIANTLSQARDAADLVDIVYVPRDSVTDLDIALRVGSHRVWDECPDNVSNVHEIGNRAETDAVFATAAHIVRRRYVITRVHAAYMEPRAAIGEYNELEGRYTLHCDAQSPHRLRSVVASELLGLPEQQLRVVTYDMGGAFGGKGHQALEHRLVLWAAKRLGRPVKWQSDRSESLLADEHGRDNIHEAELALDTDGHVLGLRAHWIANVGAYVNSDRNIQATFQNAPGMVGVYDIPVAHVKITCVMTHTMSLAPFRGAGRPEASYVIERLMDDAAREMRMDRIELRRLNLMSSMTLPKRTALGFEYDCGDFQHCMDTALQLADAAGLAKRRSGSQARGLLRGFGLANAIERAGPPGMEYAEIRFEPSGRATVLMGTRNHGQGHETAFAQMLGTWLGIPPQDIVFVEGDTDRVATGAGTFGSRSASLGGSALMLAAQKVIAKGKCIASELLEAAEPDITFEAGYFGVAGTDRRISLKEVIRASFSVGKLRRTIAPGIFESSTFAPPDNTFPYSTHVCEVELDPETGVVKIDRYSVVDDVGTVINPLLVEGQIHGGVAQGAGQILFENLAYDPESGQLLTGSFMDYAIARADTFCDIAVDEICVPTKRNPLGVKGAGEAGAVGALPAVMNAILDALTPLGVQNLDMPATPERVWRTIKAAAETDA